MSRARAIAWMFAALNTMEPPILERETDWLDGAFSAGDLMMASVLLRLKASGILDEYRNLRAYVARGEARPSYGRAFDAQLAVYAGAHRPAD